MRSVAGFISAASLVFAVACAQTDAGITTAVKTKLAADDTVKAYQVDVDTNNHVVTLKGDVDTSLLEMRGIDGRGIRHIRSDGQQAGRPLAGARRQIRVADTAATSGRLDDGVTIKVDDDLKSDAERAGAATKNAAEKAADKTVDTAKKVGDKTVQGTKKVGEKVKDVFTDDNKDSDHDGK